MPFTLRIAEGAGRGRRFRFEAESVAIGRGTGNDVVLNDAAVSRAHARIERRGVAWVLLDRASANGTHLNGAALAASAALRDGDRIRVGAVTFEFRASEGAGAAAPSGSAGWWSRLRPPARAGVISGFALVAVAGSGAASWRTGAVAGAAGGGPPVARPRGESADEAGSAAARVAVERGRRKLEERRIAPRNLYDAWRAFAEARSRLEGLEGAAALREEAAKAVQQCERELAEDCRRLLFSAARFDRYGQQDKAQLAWREILQHFPGDDPAGCRQKARAALVSAPPDDRGE